MLYFFDFSSEFLGEKKKMIRPKKSNAYLSKCILKTLIMKLYYITDSVNELAEKNEDLKRELINAKADEK